MIHSSTTIIDPYYLDTDLNKEEILHLLGYDDCMLGACEEAIAWIRSLPEDVTGQWIWDNCPVPYWYSWLLTDLWGTQREMSDLSHLDPDFYDIGSQTEEWLTLDGNLRTELENTYVWQTTRQWHDLINIRQSKIMAKLRVAIGGMSVSQKGSNPLAYKKAHLQFRLAASPHSEQQWWMIQECDRLVAESGEIKTIYRKWARKTRESGALPEWGVVRSVLRTFYNINSPYAHEFREENS